MLTPITRTGFPSELGNTRHRPASQCTLPSGQITRHSSFTGVPVLKASDTRCAIRSRSSAWMRASQSARVPPQPPGRKPYICSSFVVHVLTPEATSESNVPMSAVSCANCSRSSVARRFCSALERSIRSAASRTRTSRTRSSLTDSS